MKLVCLNVYGGMLYEPLKKFLQEADADIFCFQEILIDKSDMNFAKNFRSDFLKELKDILPTFRAFFTASNDNFGHAIFVKKYLKVDGMGSETILEGNDPPIKFPEIDLRRIVQFCQIGDLTVFNFHGFSRWPKVDTPERILQSERLLKFVSNFEGRKILCGDFNVWQDTESISMIEKRMKNLIRSLGITTTRNADFSPDDKISDYVFVSKDVKVKSFSIPDTKISDHLPLILEFD